MASFVYEKKAKSIYFKNISIKTRMTDDPNRFKLAVNGYIYTLIYYR